MAQASSVQREPSMEEILASIRRIIEDSETGSKEDTLVGDDVEKGDDMEAFHAELKPVNDLRPSISLEKVGSPEGDDSGIGKPMRAFDWPAEDRDDNEAAAAADPAALSQVAYDDEDDEDEAPMGVSSEVRSHEATRISEEAPTLRAEQPSMVARSQAAEAGRMSILSKVPGRKVAAAFEELNEALLANRRKTLDQMAEEMLQPMLQGWLDNNLPQLVERLVREEIERIARGG